MANSNIFCNVPWTNVHLYWDGGFGVCCSERSRPYAEDEWQQYNIKNHTVQEWYNLSPMKKIRSQMLGDQKIIGCQACYGQENNGYESRRIKENFKSVIFTRQAFDRSYRDSNWFERFESTKDQDAPIDWHIDWGNECNLSCKMCNPNTSSMIAGKYKKWDLSFESRKNWTTDPVAWDNFIKSIDYAPIRRLHFMGGEPMLSKRFKELVDYLISKKRNTDISISFVTNGTLIEQSFIDKLKTFKSFNIEISLESFGMNNHYIRQGLGDSTELTVNNIDLLASQQSESFQVVLRSVPQLLNINNYDQYILRAWKSKLAVQGIPLIRPAYLAINVLPLELRKTFIDRYDRVIEKIESEATTKFKTFTTGRDVSRLDIQLLNEAKSMKFMLNKPEPENVIELREELRSWLMRWDQEFKLNAFEFYPEYQQFLIDIGYEAI